MSSLKLALVLVGFSSCLLSTPVISIESNPYAIASSSVDLNLSLYGGSVVLSSDAHTTNIGNSGVGSLQSQVSVTQTITTDAPVRAGYIYVQTSGGAESIEAGARVLVSLPLSLDGLEVGVGCGGNGECQPNAGYFHHYQYLFPYQLGTTFTITGYASSAIYYTNFTGGEASALAAYDFTLLEADGVTPVAIVSAAPEPVTCGLFFLGLVCVALRQRGFQYRYGRK